MAYDFLQYGVFVLHEMYIFKEQKRYFPKTQLMDQDSRE